MFKNYNWLILLHILRILLYLISGWFYQISPYIGSSSWIPFKSLILSVIKQINLSLNDQEYHRHSNYSQSLLKQISPQTFLFMYLFIAFLFSEEKLWIFLINKFLWSITFIILFTIFVFFLPCLLFLLF